MNKRVIYTAAFGSNDKVQLMPQKKFDGIDFICFTDRPRAAKGWKQIIVEPPMGDDNTRNNRYYKLQPHIAVPDYERSIYIDSNYIVVKLPADFFTSAMQGKDMLVFDHAQNTADPRDCVYEELKALEALQQKNIVKDDLLVMQQQVNGFREENYPEHNGLISGAVLIRNHQKPAVQKLMNDWWQMVLNKSKRDQLSFNYVAWKNNFEYAILPGDSRRGNPYFYYAGKGDKNLTYTLLKYKLRKLFKPAR